MSGRGRGRGRGRGPPSASSEMLQRSAKEAGQSISQLIASRNREIYPDMRLNSSGMKWDPEQNEDLTDDNGNKREKQMVTPKRTPATIYMIAKNREMHYRITNSPFNVKTGPNIPDVLRYNQQEKLDTHKKNILHSCFQGKYTKTSQGLLFPEELLDVVNPKPKRKYARQSSSTSDDPMLMGMITEEDLMKGIKNDDEEGEKTNVDNDDEFPEEDGEEEDGADYVMDYYASDNEDDSLGENEATY